MHSEEMKEQSSLEEIEDVDSSEITKEELEEIRERSVEQSAILDDIDAMLASNGWKYVDAIIKNRIDSLSSVLSDPSISMEETFSCKHRIHGVNLILDEVNQLRVECIEARDYLLKTPISEPSE